MQRFTANFIWWNKPKLFNLMLTTIETYRLSNCRQQIFGHVFSDDIFGQFESHVIRQSGINSQCRSSGCRSQRWSSTRCLLQSRISRSRSICSWWCCFRWTERSCRSWERTSDDVILCLKKYYPVSFILCFDEWSFILLYTKTVYELNENFQN